MRAGKPLPNAAMAASERSRGSILGSPVCMIRAIPAMLPLRWRSGWLPEGQPCRLFAVRWSEVVPLQRRGQG